MSTRSEYEAFLERRKEHPGENPFIDKDAWKKFLGMKLESVRALMDETAEK